MPRKSKATLASERQWNEAVDWLICRNSDPEVNAAFNGIVEGHITRADAERGNVGGIPIIDYTNAVNELAEHGDRPGCQHCGRTDGGRGRAQLFAKVGQIRLCHTDDPGRPDCYHLATVYHDEHPLIACPTCTPGGNR